MENPCKSCGECCDKMGWGSLIASPRDLDRWEKEGRDDILDCAYLLPGMGADLWFDPETGDELDYCPFWDKTAELQCKIQDTKPEICAEFKCEKLEPVI